MIKWGIQNKKFCREVNFAVSYAENLPFKDDTFDTVCVAFGLRNFENLSLAISEIKRVLKNKGKFISIDTLKPNSAILPFYKFYLLYVIPSITNILLGKRNDYIYMAKSILNYMTQEELTDFLKKFDFENIKHINLTLGIVTITICENRKA
jgi:Methylase involved in ubiquinone/menaquinone biosynthesis